MANITAIELNKSSLELEVAAEETLIVTKTPEDGEGEITWSSSDEEVATVVNGKVTAIKAGTATITASAGENITDTCEVTVTDSEDPDPDPEDEKVGLDLEKPITAGILYLNTEKMI